MKRFKGIPGAGGICCALAAVQQAVSGQATCSLDEAAQTCLKTVRDLQVTTLERLGQEDASIFEAYEMLLMDDYLLEPIRQSIAQGIDPIEAVESSMEQQASAFSKAKSEYMRQRADDIRNLKRMLQQELRGGSAPVILPAGDERFVLVAENLSPADTMQVDTKRLAGLVTRYGGVTSHVVILAKSLGIPAVTGVQDCSQILSGHVVAVDGNTGEVILEPNHETMKEIEQAIQAQERYSKMLAQLPAGEVATQQGVPVHVSVNIGLSSDLNGVKTENIHGVGLYRTEFLFSDCTERPTISHQAAEYRRVFDALGDKTLIVRTLDIGGDKAIPYLDMPKEENPFLGCRGIRLCLRNEEIFREQLEALLLAADGKSFRIMFPMVDSVTEFLRAKNIFEDVRGALKQWGTNVDQKIHLGIMVETPAAVFSAPFLSKHVDFVSIGTNDLTQYVLAADRGNPETGVALSHYDPAVIRAIGYAIKTYTDAGVKVSVCGEAGSDIKFLPLLVAMGLRYVSVSPSMVDSVRYTISQMDMKRASVLLEAALSMETEAEIRDYLCKL